MTWKKLKVTYLLLLIASAISLSFLSINQDQRTHSSVSNAAPTTTTSFLDHPPPTAPQTTTTSTTTTTTTLPTTTTTSQASTSPAASFSDGDVWDPLADCESGERRSDGSVIPGTANWAAQGRYEGGLQFDPYTWDAYVASGKPYALVGYPDAAYKATREQQITVAIRVRDGVEGSSDPYLNAQGWEAWPTCRHEVGV
jgi:hypothetical protein